jgi:zinc transporter, ZIP family
VGGSRELPGWRDDRSRRAAGPFGRHDIAKIARHAALAVGVGYGAGDLAAGTTLAIGIGLQNAPEGLAVAVALWSAGYERRFSFLAAGPTGAVEPVADLIGAFAVSLSSIVLPGAPAFAAGAMLYVISHEIPRPT